MRRAGVEDRRTTEVDHLAKPEDRSVLGSTPAWFVLVNRYPVKIDSSLELSTSR